MRFCPVVLAMTLAYTLMDGCTRINPAVTQFGEMRAVMREGKTESRNRVADAVAQPHAFGVGAIIGLLVPSAQA